MLPDTTQYHLQFPLGDVTSTIRTLSSNTGWLSGCTVVLLYIQVHKIMYLHVHVCLCTVYLGNYNVKCQATSTKLYIHTSILNYNKNVTEIFRYVQYYSDCYTRKLQNFEYIQIQIYQLTLPALQTQLILCMLCCLPCGQHSHTLSLYKSTFSYCGDTSVLLILW